MALHAPNYRHTLVLLQPTEGESAREQREKQREGDSEVRSVHIWSFMPEFCSNVSYRAHFCLFCHFVSGGLLYYKSVPLFLLHLCSSTLMTSGLAQVMGNL